MDINLNDNLPLVILDGDDAITPDQGIVSLDPNLLTDGVPTVPGLSTCHYQALYDSIKKDGQKHPILATVNNVVVDGRLVRRACSELGITVAVRYISDMQATNCWFATCNRREWTLPDRARFVAHVCEQKLFQGIPQGFTGKGAKYENIALFARTTMGWKREINTGKQAKRFLILFKKMQQVSADIMSQLEACGNLNAALRLVTEKKKKCRNPIVDRIASGRKWLEAHDEQSPGLDASEIEQISAIARKAVELLAPHKSPKDILLLVARAVSITEPRTVA